MFVTKKSVNTTSGNSVRSYHLVATWNCISSPRRESIHSSLFALSMLLWIHDDVIKCKHFSRNWPFVRGIHRSPVNSPHNGQWRGALIFSLICGWINGWVNNREAGDLIPYRAHYDVTAMVLLYCTTMCSGSNIISCWFKSLQNFLGVQKHIIDSANASSSA